MQSTALERLVHQLELYTRSVDPAAGEAVALVEVAEPSGSGRRSRTARGEWVAIADVWKRLESLADDVDDLLDLAEELLPLGERATGRA
jgi:hypothetical protein